MNARRLLSLAEEYGTPLYVFDLDDLAARAEAVRAALTPAVRLCFSIKANPFLTGSLPDAFAQLEVCSPGELSICRAVGVAPERIFFSGVNKTARDVRAALADGGVGVMNAESPLHLSLINEAALAAGGPRVPVLLRLSAGDQFGMDEAVLRAQIENRRAYPGLDMAGLHFFSGTQKKDPAKIRAELAYLNDFCRALRQDFGFACERLEYGPGLFADYFGDAPEQSELALLEAIAPALRDMAGRYALTVEMGRFFAAPCGAYVTTVVDVKHTRGINYAIVDGGIHQIQYDGQFFGMKQPALTLLGEAAARAPEAAEWTLCGSLCSTRDVLARGIRLPALAAGDRLAFHRAGAYGVCEGPALFLSRDLPAVALDSRARGAYLARRGRALCALNTPGPEAPGV